MSRKTIDQIRNSNKILSIREIVDLYGTPIKITAEHWNDDMTYEVRGICPIGRQQSVGWFDDGVVVGFETDEKKWRTHE